MKNVLASVVGAAALSFAASALAAGMPAVGTQKCGTCHAVDHKVVGPAFKDVAAKYKGKKNAAALIATSIKTGGSFGWHYGTMPPRGLGASDQDVDTMAKYIVDLAK